MTSLTEEVKAIGWYEQRARAIMENVQKVRIQTFRNGSGISASSKKGVSGNLEGQSIE
jgi:hypothetical protein